MKELGMIKAFAELEGVELYTHDEEYFFTEDYKEYNPITVHELTFKAMVDYGVEIDYIGEIFLICIGGDYWIEIGDESLIQKSIIECILKSKGLWK